MKRVLGNVYASQLEIVEGFLDMPPAARRELEAQHLAELKKLTVEISESLKEGSVLRLHVADTPVKIEKYKKAPKAANICRGEIVEHFKHNHAQTAALVVYVTLEEPDTGRREVVAFMYVDTFYQFPEQLQMLMPDKEGHSCYISLACVADVGVTGIGALMLQTLLRECIMRDWIMIHLASIATAVGTWKKLGFNAVTNPCYDPRPHNEHIEHEGLIMSRCVFATKKRGRAAKEPPKKKSKQTKK